MKEVYHFCKTVPSKLFLLEKKLKHTKTIKELRQYEDELIEIRNSLSHTNIFGDISCYFLTDPDWLVEKYKIKGRDKKRFLSYLPEVMFLLRQIEKMEKKINWKIMYFKVMEILEIYDDKIKNRKCFNRKTNDTDWNTEFDIFLGQNCPWNILLQEKRKLFLQYQEPITRKEEYEIRKL